MKGGEIMKNTRKKYSDLLLKYGIEQYKLQSGDSYLMQIPEELKKRYYSNSELSLVNIAKKINSSEDTNLINEDINELNNILQKIFNNL